MFVFHRDELHTHTLFGASSLDSGTSAHLTCRRINEQLNEGSSGRRIRSTDEQSAQAKVVHYRNRSFVEFMPSYLDLTLTSLQAFGDGDPITDVPGWLPGLAFPKRDPRSWHLVRYLRLYGVDLRHSPYCRTLFDLP